MNGDTPDGPTKVALPAADEAAPPQLWTWPPGMPKFDIDQTDEVLQAAQDDQDEDDLYEDNMKTKRYVEEHVEGPVEQGNFMMTLMTALLWTGYPSHRVKSVMESIGGVFNMRYSLVMTPGASYHSFGRWAGAQLMKTSGSQVQLSRMLMVQKVYTEVLEDRMFPSRGVRLLKRIMFTPPFYADPFLDSLSFAATFLISGIAFGGSPNDMWICGILGYIVKLLQSDEKSQHISALGNDMWIAAAVSLVSRCVDNATGHHFCFQTLSSSSIIPMLRGGQVMQGVLDISAGSLTLGYPKIVGGMVHSICLGFGMTLGSDIYLHFAPHVLEEMMASAPLKPIQQYISADFTWTKAVSLDGNQIFPGDTGTWQGVFSLDKSAESPASEVETPYVQGCWREPAWSKFFQPLPTQSLTPLIPVFVFCASIHSQQWVFSRQTMLMTLFGVVAFWASKVAMIFFPLFNRPDYSGLVGSITIGILGNVYARFFGGTAWTVMVSGIGLLIPSGLATGGGLSGLYGVSGGSSQDEYQEALRLAENLLGVIGGLATGIFVAACFVFAFEKHPRNPLRMIF